jgi:hypothetical protein
MVANKCQYCHECLCIAKEVLGEIFECKGMVKKEIVIECNAENSDLVEGCIMCECRIANAEFPYDEYCKECAEKMKDDGR